MFSHPAQNNFTAGELSEWLSPRVDLDKYNNGASILENALVRPQGGAFGRGGTVFAAYAKYNTRTTGLIPFRFNKRQSYIVEIGHEYLRFFFDYAPITIQRSVLSVSQSPSGGIRVTTTDNHGYSTGWTVEITGATGDLSINGSWVITSIASNIFDLDSSVYNGTYAGGAVIQGIVEVSTGYQSEDVRDIQYFQIGDTLYLMHEDYATTKLLRAGQTSWSTQVVNFIDGPYLDQNTTGTTITPSGTTGSITVTASSPLFQPAHVGALFRYVSTGGSTWGYFEITGYSSSTSVSATVLGTLDATSASNRWREGMWSDVRGYASTGTMHERRSVFDGGPGAPQTIVGSVSESFEDMTPGAQDDDAYAFTIGSGEIDAIRWLVPTETLVIGTEGNEQSASGSQDGGITPSDVRIKPRTPHGSNGLKAIRVSDAVAFCQRTGRKIRALSYQVVADTYIAKDLGLLADHILEGYGVVSLAFQQERFSIIWGVQSGGQLFGITYLPEENVLAWHRHPTKDTDTWQSVAVIPSPEYDRDDPWLCCRRVLNTIRQTIEFMDPANPGLDCAKIFDLDEPTTNFYVPHLAGMTVSIVADEYIVKPMQVPLDGTLVLPKAASYVRVGLPFNGKVLPMRPEAALPGGGTTQGCPRKWGRLIVRVKDTLGLTVNGDQIPYRKMNDPMDSAVAPKSGDIEIDGPFDMDDDGRILIEQTLPLPWAVTGIFGKVLYGTD